MNRNVCASSEARENNGLKETKEAAALVDFWLNRDIIVHGRNRSVFCPSLLSLLVYAAVRFSGLERLVSRAQH
jgi:hypothetical protein